MNTVRRATPDSEAVGSSEDERPWPSTTSFGGLPREENGMPGMPGGIWSNQKRGSFKLSEAAHRNATREVRLGAANAHSALRTANTPSPAASDGAGALPFAIPLQPTPKVHRSLSHSQGQRESPQMAGGHPNTGSGGAVLPLGLLTEETDTETDSELGGQITQTVSHPHIGSLQRSATYSAAYDSPYGHTNGGGQTDHPDFVPVGLRGDRRLDAAFANLAFEPPQRRSLWQSHLGWDVPNINESRRHSLADIPTRRGSLAGDEPPVDLMGSNKGGSDYINGNSAQEDHMQQQENLKHINKNNNNNMRYNEDVTGQGFNIPASYKVPFVTINLDERTEDDLRRERQSSMGSAQLLGIGGGRPRKMLYIVSFKCSRVDVFYLLDNTGLTIREGDLVIVEADRGQDLGTVQHCNVTPDQARLFKRKYSEEQYKWLMMFSRNNQPSNVNPNAQLYGENSSRGAADSRSLLANAPATMQGLPRENFNNLKPKAIKRLANQHEIRMLGEKEGNEAKAKRACQQKVAHLHLQMEILDAEWQWDFQKLIFYYYADHYINFKDLITDLYRIYKTRIWLSAVNPASFSQHAMGQPPSGIGPGAITGYGNNTLNNTYTMAYGPDPDPYGAVPPYRIGYETYNPNYPSIPGVTNSFAPGAAADNRYPASSGPFHAVTEDNNGLPTVAPGEIQTGATSNYHYFYDRSGNNEHLMSPIETPAMTPAPTHATQASAFNPYANFYYPGAITPQASENYSPWNNNAAAHQASASLGRPAQLPQPPIGTRPASNGNAQTPNSATRNSYFEETVRPYRDSQQSATYDSQLRQATNSIGDMNLRPSSKYADEMSRER